MQKNIKSNDNNIISNNLLKFSKNTITNKITKKYESFNVIPETRDSIYQATGIEELEKEYGGQIYISPFEIKKIVNEELDKRLEHCKKKRLMKIDNSI
jgi:hypothetical protein